MIFMTTVKEEIIHEKPVDITLKKGEKALPDKFIKQNESLLRRLAKE